MTQKKIAVLVGSLREKSYNKMMAQNLLRLVPESLKLEIVSLQDLEMYNQDLDEKPPQAWINFRDKIKSFDGLLFITPEYNRSIPAVLKNALDIGSRPYGQSVWNNKPGAIISVSPGALGAFGANHHLRQSLVFLNVPTMQQPEAYIGNAAQLFDENSVLKSAATEEFMQKFINAFATWVERQTTQLEAPQKPEATQKREATPKENHSEGVKVGEEAAP